MYKYIIGNLYNCSADWNWKINCMADYDIWLVLAGHGKMEVASQHYEIGRGDCFVFNPGCKLQASHNPAKPLQMVAVHFMPESPGAAVPLILYRKLSDPDLLAKLLCKSVQYGRACELKKADYWLNVALTDLSELDDDHESFHRAGPYDNRLDEIAARIRAEPELPWTVNGLAMECCLSKDHFSKLFKQYHGLSPQDFVIQARVEVAKQNLIYSDLDVSQIADRLNYSSVYFFSRQFKQKTGMSPLAYRKSFID